MYCTCVSEWVYGNKMEEKSKDAYGFISALQIYFIYVLMWSNVDENVLLHIFVLLCEWVCEWLTERMNEWMKVNEWMNLSINVSDCKWANGWMSVCTYTCVACTCACVSICLDNVQISNIRFFTAKDYVNISSYKQLMLIFCREFMIGSVPRFTKCHWTDAS